MPDFMPFGPEWEKEMMKMPKKEIIKMFSSAIAGRESILLACQAAYAKHHMDCDLIGWDELSNILHTALCNAMGSDGFSKWIDEVSR